MNKLSRRILSMLLILALLLSNAGFAAANDDDIPSEAEIVSETPYTHEHSDHEVHTHEQSHEETVSSPAAEKQGEAAPVVEQKKEAAAPSTEEKKEEKSAPAPSTEKKQEEKSVPASEEKKEEAPAPVAEKQEEAAPAVEQKKEETVTNTEETAPSTEQKKEEKSAPAAEERKEEEAPAPAEEKKEETSASSGEETPADKEPEAEPDKEIHSDEKPTETPAGETPAGGESGEEPNEETPASEVSGEEPKEEFGEGTPAGEESGEEPGEETPASEESEDKIGDVIPEDEESGEEPGEGTLDGAELSEDPEGDTYADGESEDQSEEDNQPAKKASLRASAEACTHENYSEHSEDKTEYEYQNLFYHVRIEKHITYKVCEDCDETFDVVVEAENRTEEDHTWNNSVCEYCGHRYECQHERLWENRQWDWADYTYAELNETHHQRIGTIQWYAYCRDCNARVDLSLEEGHTEQEHHVWNDEGVCSICGYVNQCQHEHLNPDNESWSWVNYTYAEYDRKNHKIIGDIQWYNYCPDCIFKILLSYEEDHTEIVPHRWTAGKCIDCGQTNQCQHENAEGETWSWVDYTYVSLDVQKHQIIGDIQWYGYCPDCGLFLTLSREEGHMEEPAYHEWNDEGVCIVCGYVNQCQHEHKKSSIQWDSIDRYESVSEQQHKVIGSVTITEYCDDCLECLNESSIEHYEEVNPHSWINNSCLYCYYENTCQHEHKSSIIDWNSVHRYESVDEQQHKVIGSATIIEYCEDCSERFGETTIRDYEQLERHSWENGLCKCCNAENTCHHSSEYRIESFEWNSVRYDYIDQQYHKAVGNATEYDYCNKCGEYVNVTVLENYERIDSHSWSNGVCAYCNAENTCQHNNVYYDYNPGWGTVNYEYVDASRHKAIGQALIMEICRDCGECFRDWITDDYVEMESHTWENGACKYCNATNPCQHNNEFRFYSYVWNSVNYECVDEQYHKATGNATEYEYCDECGECISETTLENDEKLEKHSWEKGFCQCCNTENTCQHSSKFYEYEIDWNTVNYKNINATEHKLTARATVTEYCENCCELLGERVEENYERLESHWWSDGVCLSCHAENICEHKNRETISWDWKSCDCEYVDAGHHRLFGEIVKYDYCPDCDEYFEGVVIENYEEIHNHNWINGVCEDCGAENMCQHNNGVYQETKTTGEDSIYAYVDAMKHKAIVHARVYDYCEDCGLCLKETYVDRYELPLSDHNWIDGICNQCNADINCRHETFKKYTYIIDDETASYSPFDALRHKVVGDAYEYDWCRTCGALLNMLLIPDYETYYKHSWIDGVCLYCDAENECEHEHLEDRSYWSSASLESVDDKTHKLYGQVEIGKRCLDCGEWFLESTEYREEIYQHTFAGCPSCECGYVNTCKHDCGTVDASEWERITERIDNHNGITHHLKGTYHHIISCEQCGQWLEDNYEKERDEEHSFVDGICQECGASNEAAPAGVKGTISGTTASGRKTTITWTAVAGAKGYNVYGGTGGVYNKLNTSLITGLSFSFNNPSYGKKYTYYVTVVTEKGESRYSSAVTTTALKKTALNVTPTKYGAKLTWTKVVGATGYKIMRGSTVIATIKSGSTVSYVDKKFKTAGKKCTYSVVPYTTGIYSTTTVKKAYKHMAAVTKVTLKNSSAKKLAISWAKAKGANSYEVYYTTSKTKPAASTKAKKTTGKTSLTVSVKKGKTYYVYVRAVGKNGTTKTKGVWTAVKKLKITR